ncbi:hypothetical protein [Geomonas agri]|uniref:hypothetical protein n=1 Tax=Geomonas agri TaxID=2873702 RepID=UPI001CD678E9|nr:hypothetical protein [Geomonas agri]
MRSREYPAPLGTVKAGPAAPPAAIPRSWCAPALPHSAPLVSLWIALNISPVSLVARVVRCASAHRNLQMGR